MGGGNFKSPSSNAKHITQKSRIRKFEDDMVNHVGGFWDFPTMASVYLILTWSIDVDFRQCCCFVDSKVRGRHGQLRGQVLGLSNHGLRHNRQNIQRDTNTVAQTNPIEHHGRQFQESEHEYKTHHTEIKGAQSIKIAKQFTYSPSHGTPNWSPFQINGPSLSPRHG